MASRESLRSLLEALKEPGFKQYLLDRIEVLRTRLENGEDPKARGGLVELREFSRLEDRVREQLQKVTNEELTNREE